MIINFSWLHSHRCRRKLKLELICRSVKCSSHIQTMLNLQGSIWSNFGTEPANSFRIRWNQIRCSVYANSTLSAAKSVKRDENHLEEGNPERTAQHLLALLFQIAVSEFLSKSFLLLGFNFIICFEQVRSNDREFRLASELLSIDVIVPRKVRTWKLNFSWIEPWFWSLKENQTMLSHYAIELEPVLKQFQNKIWRSIIECVICFFRFLIHCNWDTWSHSRDFKTASENLLNKGWQFCRRNRRDQDVFCFLLDDADNWKVIDRGPEELKADQIAAIW